MRTIKLDEVIERLDLIIDDEDTEDLEIGHTNCQHFQGSRPQCLVGQLFDDLGLTPQQVNYPVVSTAIIYLRVNRVIGFSPEARDFLVKLQYYADSNDTYRQRSWREALDRTLHNWELD